MQEIWKDIEGNNISYQGIKAKSISDLARKKGINVGTALSRLSRGWTLEEAIEIPVERQNKELRVPLYSYKKQFLSVKQLAEKYNINYKTLHKRLSRGWSIEEAIEIPITKKGVKYEPNKMENERNR